MKLLTPDCDGFHDSFNFLSDIGLLIEDSREILSSITRAYSTQVSCSFCGRLSMRLCYYGKFILPKNLLHHPLCLICNAQEESIEHLLVLCLCVELVWFGGELVIRLHRHEVTTWPAWLITCLEAVSGLKSDKSRVLSYIAFTCWHIWKTRCNFLFNQQPINHQQVILTISTSIGAFLAAI